MFWTIFTVYIVVMFLCIVGIGYFAPKGDDAAACIIASIVWPITISILLVLAAILGALIVVAFPFRVLFIIGKYFSQESVTDKTLTEYLINNIIPNSK